MKNTAVIEMETFCIQKLIHEIGEKTVLRNFFLFISCACFVTFIPSKHILGQVFCGDLVRKNLAEAFKAIANFAASGEKMEQAVADLAGEVRPAIANSAASGERIEQAVARLVTTSEKTTREMNRVNTQNGSNYT